MGAQESQRLRDPVYGLIVFGGGPDAHVRETDQIAWKLINTREFQSLRRICRPFPRSANVSKTIQAPCDESRSIRLYAPDNTKFPELDETLKEVNG